MTTIRYELDKITKYVSDTHMLQDVITVSPDTSIEQSIVDESTRIKTAFMNELISMTSELQLERYIRYHQQGIINLMNITRGKTKSVATDHDDRKLLQIIHHVLDDLLGFVEKNFNQYVDYGLKCPHTHLAIARREGKSNILKIHKGLTKAGAGTVIINILLQPVWRVAARSQHEEITYRDVLYAKGVQQQLLDLVRRENKQQDIQEELNAMIYYLNINTLTGFSYGIDAVTNVLKNADTRQDRVERLSLSLKIINQFQVRSGMAYHHELPSLKFQVIDYITEEMQHLERIQQMTRSGLSSDTPAVVPFKMKYEISVSQLSYMMKLFIETKLVRNTNLTELLRFVARTAVTKRAEEVSFDSLRTKYYNVEKGARESVRTILTSMIRFIDMDQS